MKLFPISKRGLLLVLSGAAALLVVACGGGGQDPASADGRAQPLGLGLGSAITWTPATITDTANPGSRQDIPVTFISSANVANVTVSVVPALQNLVSVTPTSFASLQKGQVATVTLTVAPAAAASLGTIEGTVHLRSGSSTIAKPLAVTVTLVAPEVINGIAVPPEPPAALNNATLAGFDANGNGVRDDVERYISVTYAQSEKARSSLFQLSKAIGNDLLVSPSDSTALSANELINVRAEECATYVLQAPILTSFDSPVSQQAVINFSARTELLKRYLNTQGRLAAYESYGVQAVQIPYSLRQDHNDAQSCDVDPSTLPN